MSKGIDAIQNALEVAGVAIAGVQTIAGITENATDDKIAEAMTLVRGVAGVVLSAINGESSPASALRAIEAFEDKRAAKRVSRDDEVSEKYRKAAEDKAAGDAEDKDPE